MARTAWLKASNAFSLVSDNLTSRNAICSTPSLDADSVARVAATVPLGRLGTPGDVGDTCLYLASPLASYVSGANILMHGGGERPALSHPFLGGVPKRRQRRPERLHRQWTDQVAHRGAEAGGGVGRDGGDDRGDVRVGGRARTDQSLIAYRISLSRFRPVLSLLSPHSVVVFVAVV